MALPRGSFATKVTAAPPDVLRWLCPRGPFATKVTAARLTCWLLHHDPPEKKYPLDLTQVKTLMIVLRGPFKPADPLRVNSASWYIDSQMAGRILDYDQVFAERQRMRTEGRRLVFTNGVFDLIHIGHVRYLAQARGLGDALVVAINSDRCVRQLKGAGRPLVSAVERAEVLAALRPVTYVVIFDDHSPRSMIAALLPDVLVKGGDYRLDEIHGREEVEAAGGRVIALNLTPDASTSLVIKKFKNNKDRRGCSEN